MAKAEDDAYLSITRGQRGGMYQAARLDDMQLTIPTFVETVQYSLREEILLGKYSLVDLMNNILDGFVERMYVQVIEALQNATVSPANQGSAAGIDNEVLDGIIR